MTNILPLTRNEPAAPAMQPVDGAELQQVDGGLINLAPWVITAIEWGGAMALAAGVGFTAYRVYRHLKDK